MQSGTKQAIRRWLPSRPHLSYLIFLALALAMASMTLPSKLSLFMPTVQNRGTPSTTAVVPPVRNLQHSQFLGLRLSQLPAFVTTRTVHPKATVYAKVNKGDVPPAISLKDQDGKSVSLSKFKGKPLVLYFYPADETPGCTKQACAFRDSYEKFKMAGADVVGISGDDPASHKAFAKKYRLPFTLLSDEGNKVRKQWGVPSDLFGTLPGRQTYVIDRNGVVQLVYNNQFQPEKHVDETLKLLKNL